jgi:murein DD-endopeptidase MepM/ murein hydrolase activator NlpD
VRGKWSILLVSLCGCTAYQPVAWNGHGSWAQARVVANARPAMPADLDRFLNDSSRRPIAGGAVAGADGGRHLVLPGETLSGVAVRYGTPVAVLAKVNGVQAPYKVYAGQVLAIPGTTRRAVKRSPSAPMPAANPPRATVAAQEPPRPVAARRAEPVRVADLAPVPAPVEVAHANPPPMTAAELEATRRAAQKPPPPLSGDGFLWPVRGSIDSAFGAKPNGARNDGINIRAAEGTPVLAAENGVVVYAGDEIPSYGHMLLISHADGLTTAYAHNGSLLVRVGAVVDRGQEIATVGRTGDVTSPQLHFELRDGKEPIDPVAHFDNARTRVASTP